MYFKYFEQFQHHSECACHPCGCPCHSTGHCASERCERSFFRHGASHVKWTVAAVAVTECWAINFLGAKCCKEVSQSQWMSIRNGLTSSNVYDGGPSVPWLVMLAIFDSTRLQHPPLIVRSLSVFAFFFLGSPLQKDKVLMQPLNYSRTAMTETRSTPEVREILALLRPAFIPVSFGTAIPSLTSSDFCSATSGLDAPTLGFCPLSHLTLQV